MTGQAVRHENDRSEGGEAPRMGREGRRCRVGREGIDQAVELGRGASDGQGGAQGKEGKADESVRVISSDQGGGRWRGSRTFLSLPPHPAGERSSLFSRAPALRRWVSSIFLLAFSPLLSSLPLAHSPSSAHACPPPLSLVLPFPSPFPSSSPLPRSPYLPDRSSCASLFPCLRL